LPRVVLERQVLKANENFSLSSMPAVADCKFS
jgi:hypothetical protein